MKLPLETDLCCKLVPLSSPTQPSRTEPLSPEFLDPPEISRNLWKYTFLRAIPCSFGSNRCYDAQKRFWDISQPLSPTHRLDLDASWIFETTSVHQVQPAGVVFRDSDGPKAFRIRRTGPAAPARATTRMGSRSSKNEPIEI